MKDAEEYAITLIKTMATLSSGSFIITCNFLTENNSSKWIKLSLLLFFFSIMGCLLSMKRITGLIKKHKEIPLKNIKDNILDNPILIYRVQFSYYCFFFGCLFLLIHVFIQDIINFLSFMNT